MTKSQRKYIDGLLVVRASLGIRKQTLEKRVLEDRPEESPEGEYRRY